MNIHEPGERLDLGIGRGTQWGAVGGTLAFPAGVFAAGRRLDVA